MGNAAANEAWKQRKKEENAKKGRQVWDDKNRVWIREER